MEQTERRHGPRSGKNHHRKLEVYDTEEGLALLQELARRRGVSAAAAMRELIREEAARVGLVVTPADGTSDATEPGTGTDSALGSIAAGGLRVPTTEERAAQERLRELAGHLRDGKRVSPRAIRREVEILQRHAVIVPPDETGPAAPDWRSEFRGLLEEVRAGIPEEWSEEDLKQRVEQAVAAVRKELRAQSDPVDFLPDNRPRRPWWP